MTASYETNTKVKALLLGVSLHQRESEPGTKVSIPIERTKLLKEALNRLTLDIEGLEPDTLGSMLGDAEEVIQWLIDHPQAKVRIGYWLINIVSPDFSDVDWERYDQPFAMEGVVEDFHKSRCKDGWECGWNLG